MTHPPYARNYIPTQLGTTQTQKAFVSHSREIHSSMLFPVFANTWWKWMRNGTSGASIRCTPLGSFVRSFVRFPLQPQRLVSLTREGKMMVVGLLLSRGPRAESRSRERRKRVKARWDRTERTKTGPCKNRGNVCESMWREQEGNREARKRKKRESRRGPLLRALLLRPTVTNNYCNRPGD